MNCEKCKRDFIESEIHESHNVPTYIFDGERKVRKQKADIYGRQMLCKKCHDIYEKTIFSVMIKQADYNTKLRMIKSAERFAKGWINDNRTD